MIQARVIRIQTLGCRALRVRLPRMAVTAWVKDRRLHIRVLWLPRARHIDFGRHG